MSVQRIVAPTGGVTFKARVKYHGRQVTARRFDRRIDALAWEREQLQRLQLGDWIDPRRAQVSLHVVAEGWLLSRAGVKRRTRETDELVWRRYIAPTFGRQPLNSITSAQVSEWAAQIVGKGLSAATARRALATLRLILAHAIADERLLRNPAAAAQIPRGDRAREGEILSLKEIRALAAACRGKYGDLIIVLAFTGVRWGELAGMQVGDLVVVPAAGVRLQRAVLAGGGSGDLFVDSLKTGRSRTVPLPGDAADIVERWSTGRGRTEWIFPATNGAPLREGNWKRMIDWTNAKNAIGRPSLRVHDLRHTAASLWLGFGADAKVVQRVLGHATATMTLDLYGHLIDDNLWASAKSFGDQTGTKNEMRSEEDHV